MLIVLFNIGANIGPDRYQVHLLLGAAQRLHEDEERRLGTGGVQSVGCEGSTGRPQERCMRGIH